MRSVLIQLLIVIFVAIVSWLIWNNWSYITGSNQNTNTIKAERPPTAVDAKSVRIDDITVNMEIVGNLNATDAIDITSEVSGVINSIKFTEGQTVKKGSILFTLDSRIEKAEVNRWTALLERRQRLSNSAKKLSETNNIAKTKLDQLLTNETEAEAELKIAKVKLNKKSIRAAFDGRIGLKNASIGQYIEPGEKVTTLDSINPIQLDFEVPESAISKLIVGTEINTYTRAWENELFIGTIQSIDTRVNKNSRSITVRANIDNTNLKLKPGMFMIVKLPIMTRKNAIIVPEESILTDGTQRTIYIIDEGITKAKSVKLGQRLSGEVEILEGLENNAMVITGGIQKVRDGSKVTIR